MVSGADFIKLMDMPVWMLCEIVDDIAELQERES